MKIELATIRLESSLVSVCFENIDLNRYTTPALEILGDDRRNRGSIDNTSN